MDISFNQVNYASFSVFRLNENEPFHEKRYHKAFNMREVIVHAQPSSGTMGPCVRPNATCISRLLHIVDTIICLC